MARPSQTAAAYFHLKVFPYSLIDLSFWRAPDRLFDEHEELIAWARAALAAAHRVAAKRGNAQVRENRGRPHGSKA